MSVPTPWVMILLIGAAFRVWRLFAVDRILDRPRCWFVNLPRDWNEDEDDLPENYNEKLAEFIECPWCFGGWIAIIIWAIWQVSPHDTEVICGLLTMMAGVGITRGMLDPPE